MGRAGRDQSALDEGLPAEVRQLRVRGRIGDADVDDATDAGVGGRFEEQARVRDGLVEACAPMGEADPVGVVEGADAFERGGQRSAVVEAVRTDVEVGPCALSVWWVSVRTERPWARSSSVIDRPV